MVAAEGDDSWQGLTVLCGALLLGVCGGGAGEDAVVAFFDLVEGPCVVVPVTSINTRLVFRGSGRGRTK